jgi:uncharacterized membrane protein (UPF0127 family)
MELKLSIAVKVANKFPFSKDGLSFRQSILEGRVSIMFELQCIEVI